MKNVRWMIVLLVGLGLAVSTADARGRFVSKLDRTLRPPADDEGGTVLSPTLTGTDGRGGDDGDRECEHRCHQEAEAVFRACMETTDSHEACREEATEFLRGCLTDVCGVVPDCREACHHEAAAAYHECVDQGGTEPDCGVQAREHVQRDAYVKKCI